MTVKAIICCELWWNVRKSYTLNNFTEKMDCSSKGYHWSRRLIVHTCTSLDTRSSLTVPFILNLTIWVTSITISTITIIAIKLESFTITTYLNTVRIFGSLPLHFIKLKSFNACFTNTLRRTFRTVRRAWFTFIFIFI